MSLTSFWKPFSAQSQSRSFEDKQSFQCVSKDNGMLGCVETTLRLGAVWRVVSIKLVFEPLAVKQRFEKLFETEFGLLLGHVRQAISIPEF